jgi:hypothetical protein
MAEINESVAFPADVLNINNNGIRVASIGSRGGYRDTSGLTRFLPNATAKTILDASPTALFSCTLGASSVAGGSMFFLIEARDATNTQTISGIATYSAVATSAGTVTGAITYDAANEAKTLSSGTLTLAFTANVSGSTISFRVQPTGSLTETTYNIRYTLLPIVSEVTVL